MLLPTMISTVRLGLILTFIFVQVVRGCPNGWTEYGNSCYMAFIDTQDWSAASTTCHKKRAYLAEIGDEKENEFLRRLVGSLHHRGTNHESYWLGGSDIFVEGDWRWGDGNEAMNYTNWHSGQPDNNYKHVHGEDCLEGRYTGSHFLWFDEPCRVNRNYICETARGKWIQLG